MALPAGVAEDAFDPSTIRQEELVALLTLILVVDWFLVPSLVLLNLLTVVAYLVLRLIFSWADERRAIHRGRDVGDDRTPDTWRS